jgi:hypothetical protein
VEKKGMRIALLIAGAAFSAVAITAVFAQSESNDGSALTRKRYLPEYTASGDLILPKNFNELVFVGSPLTPNALNDGKANFPEFHNVYIEPGSYEIYKKTGEFPEGTIFFKELQLTLPAAAESTACPGQFGSDRGRVRSAADFHRFLPCLTRVGAPAT